MAESTRQGVDLFTQLRDGVAVVFADRGRVRLHVQGANAWRDFASWPPPGSRQERLYLQAGGGLSATPPAAASAPTTYVYDPADPTPSIGGPHVMADAKHADMSALERRSDTISFTSAPLAADMEAIGPVSAELCVRSDRAHTDFFVCLCEVNEAGRPLHVVDGYVRLRPSDAPADAAGVRRITVECWPTAFRFRRGRRLRLIVASGAHPRYARNLGTGEPLATATRMQAARQEILHEPAHASCVCVTLASAGDMLPG
jgi:putative CocE/NonD family hydrolase